MKKIMLAMGMFCVVGNVWAAHTRPANVFFLVMGGRTSCGSGELPATTQAMDTPFMKMLGELKTAYPDVNFQYALSCLDTSPPPDGEGSLTASVDPTISQMVTGNDLVKIAEQSFGATGGVATFVIGHSYGGYLAMYVGQNAQLSGKFDGIFSIDPISPKCGPSEIVFQGQDCFQSPQEMDNAAILSHTKRWLNFYQDADPWLHSSSVDGAENTFIEYHDQHNQIDIDTRTWAAIEGAVKSDLN